MLDAGGREFCEGQWLEVKCRAERLDFKSFGFRAILESESKAEHAPNPQRAATLSAAKRAVNIIALSLKSRREFEDSMAQIPI